MLLSFFLTLVAGFISVALLVMIVTAISNAFIYQRLDDLSPPDARVRVSVLIPARNEAGIIRETVERLLRQRYPRFELLVLDDNSSDGTGRLANQAAAGDQRFKLLEGTPLPGGWLGKNWACHQLALAARGDVLLFTDADVRWEPGALNSVLHKMEQEQADCLSVWPTQQTITAGERLVVPLMSLAILAYLPLLVVHRTSWPLFAAANGQCLAITRTMYGKCGGHAAVSSHIVEDVALARAVKSKQGRLRLVDGNRQIQTHMYSGWPAVRSGFGKNILAGHANSEPLLLLSTVFHWLVFLFPWVWLAVGWLTDVPFWPAWPTALIGGGLFVRALTAALTRQRVLDALFMPLSVLLMTRIALQSWRWHRRGGPQWKGRTITRVS